MAPQEKAPAVGGPGLLDAVQAGAKTDPEFRPFIHIAQLADSVILMTMMRIGDRRLRMMLAEVEYAATLLKERRVAPAGAIMLLRDAGPLVCDLCNLPDDTADNGFRFEEVRA
jgi:hypothetical protein